MDGVALRVARKRKERIYLELVRPGQKAKLVVLAGEVAGRWSEETASFLRQLATLQGPTLPNLLCRKKGKAGMETSVGVVVGQSVLRKARNVHELFFFFFC